MVMMRAASVDSPEVARPGAHCDRREAALPQSGTALFARFRRKPVCRSKAVCRSGPVCHSTGITGRFEKMSDAHSSHDHGSGGDAAGRHRGPASSTEEAEAPPQGRHRRPSDD
jgi:hypothetical protein